jgi:hypothetical protein
MANDANEAKKLLKEIEELYKRIGSTNPFDGKKAADFVGKIHELKDGLDEANNALHDMDGGINDLFKSWKAIVEEVGGYNKATTSSKKSISSLMSITEKLKDHQKQISVLSAKQLKSLQEQYESNQDTLTTTQAQLKANIDILKDKQKSIGLTVVEARQLKQNESLYNNAKNLIDDKESILFSTHKALIEEAKLTKKVEKEAGILGGTLKGISKIPILGDVFDADIALKEAEKSIRNGSSALGGMKAAFKNIGTQIKEGLLNPANLVQAFFIQMIDALKSVDDGAGQLAKSMNMTYSEALGTQKELTAMAASSFDVALNTKNLSETLMFVGKQLGSNAKLNEADLKIYTKLREQAGYTNEELYGIQQLSLVNNKSLEDNTEEILGGAKAYASRNKLVVNEKDILREVSKASATIKLSLGGSAEAVAEAAVQAKQFGLNLEQADKIAQSLLQFESSIESELSAELLLGKDLNFEKARQLSLNNDIAGAAEEIAKQVGTSADFTKMNAIQQEAIAKAAGLTKDELAKSLMDREALQKLSAKEGESAQEAFNRLVKEVGMEEAKKQLGEEGLANQFEQQSIQERFVQTVEKLKEIFVSLAEPVLAIVSPIADLVGYMASIVGFVVDWGKYLIPILAAYKTFQLITATMVTLKQSSNIADAISLRIGKSRIAQEIILQALILKESIASVIGGAWKSLGPIPFIGAALASIAAVAGVGYLMSQANDMVSPGESSNGYGKRTLFGPEGAIQLNDKDTVLAGTNLFDKGNDVYSGPQNMLSVSNSTAPKRESTVNPNAGMEMKMDNMIKAINTYNSIPTLRIQ